MGEAAVKCAKAANYRGVGTVEFLLDKDGDFFFMEMNTRIQVEHPVTELVTGFDLVQEQIKVAANHALSMRQDQACSQGRLQGHAIECRVNAEDPFDNFKPCPGLIERFEPPEKVDGVRVRVDTHVSSGTRIPVYYDSLICKLIVMGDNRERARLGMLEALKRFRVDGIKTTIPLHIKILESAAFASGDYDTGLVAELLK